MDLPHRVATQANESAGNFEFLVFGAHAFELHTEDSRSARQRACSLRHLV